MAWSAAILAQVPVPQAERSSAPVQVAGPLPVDAPVEMTTVFLRSAPAASGGAENWAIVTPAIAGFSGWTAGNCSRAAALIFSPSRTMSRPSSGVSRSPTGAASAMT